MKPIKHKNVELIDARQRQIGRVTIERNEGDLIFGAFDPRPAFADVQRLFQNFEEAVEVQALSVVDELDAKIAELGLHFRLPSGKQIEVHDVQIYSDGGMTCRPRDSARALIDAASASTEAVQLTEVDA